MDKFNRLNGLNLLNRYVWMLPVCVILTTVGLPSLAHPAWDDFFTYVQPYITLQEEYTSNVDLSPTDERDDFITTISPGLRVSTLKRSSATGDFRAPPSTAGEFGEFRVPSVSEGEPYEEQYGVYLDVQLPIVFYA